jgi:hypothetical protein
MDVTAPAAPAIRGKGSASFRASIVRQTWLSVSLRFICMAMVSVGASLFASSAGAEQKLDLSDVLERAAAYVQQYRETFVQVVADEHYLQEVQEQLHRRASPASDRWSVTEKRELTSELVLVRLDGDLEWIGFRDVISVDDRQVPHRKVRAAQLLGSDARYRRGLVRSLLEESARYNIGRIVRNFNDPLLPLLFISREHQHRFRFRSRGEEEVEGVRVARIEYVERERPTLIRSQGLSSPSSGVLWIDTATGALVRSEHEVGGRRRESHAHTVITYRPDPRLGLRVPVEMREVYTHPEGERVVCTAMYSNFRRFEVDSRLLIHPF